MNTLLNYISRLTPGQLLAQCLVLVAAIGILDYQTGYEMNMAVVYLAPVFVVAWAMGSHAAIVMSIICTTAWYVSLLHMHQEYSHPLLYVWDGAIQFAMFVTFGVVIARLKSALSNADERFAAVLEGLDAAVYVADDHTGAVLYANEQFRKTFGEGSKRPALPPGVREGEMNDETSGRSYLVHSRPMRWVDGRVVTLRLATDITDRRKADALFRQQQQKMQRMARLVTVGEMASTIAHELNQPLAAITNYTMGCVRRLRAGNVSEQEIVEAMDKAAAQAERASKVVQRVRALVSRRAPNVIACDINEVLAGVASIMSLEARQNGAGIALELSESVPYVQADPLLIEQVILNLARNGIEAMEETPAAERQLTIRSRSRDEGSVEVQVVDSGRGIDRDVEANLFTPFFSTKPHGMGLGLHICRSIIEAHGGHVGVKPNTDRGTTIEFSLKTVYA